MKNDLFIFLIFCGPFILLMPLMYMWAKYTNYMNEKSKHGGKRIGAGRKSIYAEETQTISFRVPKSLIEPITKYVKRAMAKKKK